VKTISLAYVRRYWRGFGSSRSSKSGTVIRKNVTGSYKLEVGLRRAGSSRDQNPTI